jgi:hypothetical protein
MPHTDGGFGLTPNTIAQTSGRAGASSWSDLPVSGRAEVPPRSDLSLNRILYIPFSIFAYSSNIVIASLVRIESMLVEGTLNLCAYFQQNKKKRGSREGKCHAKTMMSTKANERLKERLSMYLLDRTRRKKYEGRG